MYQTGGQLVDACKTMELEQANTVKRVRVTDEKQGKTFDVEFSGTTVKELLKLVNINIETVIVTRGEEVLLSSDTVEDTDTIVLLSVISGG